MNSAPGNLKRKKANVEAEFCLSSKLTWRTNSPVANWND
jgi:hypothetical protein